MQSALAAIAAAVPPGARVAELYAGSGAIGLALAAAGRAAAVMCVEINPECRWAGGRGGGGGGVVGGPARVGARRGSGQPAAAEAVGGAGRCGPRQGVP
jgi:hypothetical protein